MAFIVALLAGLLICGLVITACALFLCGMSLRILSALTEEGIGSESFLETGFRPIIAKIAERIAFRRDYPSGRIPKA